MKFCLIIFYFKTSKMTFIYNLKVLFTVKLTAAIKPSNGTCMNYIP